MVILGLVRPELTRRLVCPSCTTPLDLRAFDEEGGRVREGVLLCDGCSTWYPIVSAVPVLLDFRTAAHDRFVSDHGGELAGYTLPRGRPRPGEESVQQTFGEEWAAVVDSELSFTYSEEDLESLNRRVWLAFLGERPEVSRLLDIGCGLGAETLALRKVTGADEVVGIDLNLSLLAGGAPREAPEGTHFAVASIFALPFERASFDLVYSQGVLHHTYSTEAAFSSVSAFVAERGYLFVWVYGQEDRLGLDGRRAVVTRTLYVAEQGLRPALARAPEAVREAFFKVASRAAHPLLRPRVQHPERWGRENTEHYLRDMLSPRFAWRHRWNEVLEWFERDDYEIVGVQSPNAYRELFGDRLWGVGVAGRRRG
ncbi:MAG: methyltransferase domain-containing protein [Actinobacteria bacterium]|nr:methyltransferase domain-containing protein [Actinomycetota bacterium]